MSASPSPSPRSRGGRSPDREGPREGDGREDNAGTIFVGNLNHETTEKRLKDFFEAYGRVLTSKVVINNDTGRSKGFGFVKFEDTRDAEDAIKEADGLTLDGRTIKCNFAKYQPGRGPPPYRGGYGRGGFRGDFRGGYRGGRGGGRFNGHAQGYGYRGDGPPPQRGRSRSPGRYSPGRYSPGRYSPHEGADAASPRSRSGSPAVPKRKRAPSQSPVRGPPTRVRRSASRSSDSRSSGSYSSTGSDDSKGVPGRPPKIEELKRRRESGAVPSRAAAPPAAPAAAAAPAAPAAKQELVHARRREDELSTRLAAMEAELGAARTSRTDLLEQLAELTQRLQKAEESSRQYKKWLKSMADYSRALLGAYAAMEQAKQECKGREEDLSLFLEQADTFLQARERSRRKRQIKEIEGAETAHENGITGDGSEVPAPTAGAAAAAAAPAEAEAAPAQNGSWKHQENEHIEDEVAAKFKPGIKFKIAT